MALRTVPVRPTGLPAARSGTRSNSAAIMSVSGPIMWPGIIPRTRSARMSSCARSSGPSNGSGPMYALVPISRTALGRSGTLVRFPTAECLS